MVALTSVQECQIHHWPDTFEKYPDTPPISIAILLQKYVLHLAESSKNTTNLYHDTAPIVSQYFCRSIRVRGRRNTLNRCMFSDFVVCKILWPFFSRKPPALTSINRRKSVINPEIASINVCEHPIFCDFSSVFCGNPHCPLQTGTDNTGFFGTIPD